MQNKTNNTKKRWEIITTTTTTIVVITTHHADSREGAGGSKDQVTSDPEWPREGEGMVTFGRPLYPHQQLTRIPPQMTPVHVAPTKVLCLLLWGKGGGWVGRLKW